MIRTICRVHHGADFEGVTNRNTIPDMGSRSPIPAISTVPVSSANWKGVEAVVSLEPVTSEPGLWRKPGSLSTTPGLHALIVGVSAYPFIAEGSVGRRMQSQALGWASCWCPPETRCARI